MGLLFEWDSNKAKLYMQKHGISFDEASTAFRDPLSYTIYRPFTFSFRRASCFDRILNK